MEEMIPLKNKLFNCSTVRADLETTITFHLKDL